MKVLHLHTKINKVCGISRVLKCIFENPINDLDLYGLFEGGENFDLFQKQYKNIYKLHSTNFISRIWEIYNFVKHNKIDIIHSHHRYYDLLAFFIKKIYPKIKTVMSAHYHSTDKKYFSYKADHIICVSDKIKQTVIKNYRINENKISVLYNPVDASILKLSKPRQELCVELNIKEDSIIIAYIGRFNYDVKNIEIITDNLENILTLSQKIKMLFIGAGKDLTRLQKEIENYNAYVKIIISPENLYDYYNLVDIVIMPSRIEPFGLVTLEAGLFKKVVIANSKSAISEYLTENENVVLFDSTYELMNAIIKIINDRDFAARIGNSLYDYVMSNHDAKNYMQKLYEIYLNLLEK